MNMPVTMATNAQLVQVFFSTIFLIVQPHVCSLSALPLGLGGEHASNGFTVGFGFDSLRYTSWRLGVLSWQG